MVEKFFIPSSASEAARQKDKNSAFLAGGTEINRLNSTINVKTLISIGRLGLDIIKVTKINGKDYVRVGATATFTDLISSPVVPTYLKNSCKFLSSSVRRNMATIGGNVALCRDDSYLIPTLIASDAFIEFSNRKKIKVKQYVKEHEKYSDMLIVAFYVDPFVLVNSKKYSNTASGHAYVTVAVSEKNVAVQIKGVGLIETSEIEKSSDRSEKFCINWAKNLKEKKIKSDMFGSSSYKRYLAGITVSILSSEMSVEKKMLSSEGELT